MGDGRVGCGMVQIGQRGRVYLAVLPVAFVYPRFFQLTAKRLILPA